MGQDTERIKPTLRREVFNIFRKSVEKLELLVKEKQIEKRKKVNNNSEEEVVYRINCKKCETIYIG